MTDFHLSVLARDQCAIVWACGQCDVSNATRLREHLAGVLAVNSARMVLDLSGLAMLDGAAIDALAAVGQIARQLGGSLAITAGPNLALSQRRHRCTTTTS